MSYDYGSSSSSEEESDNNDGMIPGRAQKNFFVKSLLLRIRLSTGKTLSPNSNFCLRNRFQKFSMDFSDFFGALYDSIYYHWRSNFPWHNDPLHLQSLQIN